MRKIISTMLLLLLTSSFAVASDWHYVSSTDYKKRYVLQLYDEETFVRTGHHVKFWIEGVVQDTALSKATKADNIKAIERIRRGYFPRAWMLSSLQKKLQNFSTDEGFGMLVAATLIEQLANSYQVQPSFKFHIEIDCANNQSRVLSGAFYNDDGSSNNGGAEYASEWQEIVPDSNPSTFFELFCK